IYFIEQSEKAVARQVRVEDISALPVMRRLRRMGEEIGEDDLGKFDELRLELDEECTDLTKRAAQNAG
ncbi:MAG: ATPase, partial [Pseudomonadota bacterium]|nr:ATPase [Pseudomonadota bacterium]